MVFRPVQADHVGQGFGLVVGEGLTRLISRCQRLDQAILQISQGQEHDGMGFKGLQLIIGNAQTGFEVKVIHFGGPAVTITNQSCLCRQGQIGTQEVSRSFTPGMPLRDEDADVKRNLIEPPF